MSLIEKRLIKEGDIVKIFDLSWITGNQTYTGEVLFVKNGLFGKKYLCEWVVNDLDFGIEYKTVGWVKEKNIIKVY